MGPVDESSASSAGSVLPWIICIGTDGQTDGDKTDGDRRNVTDTVRLIEGCFGRSAGHP
jgi:hypothetical protein